jgi:energy-coupling factor transporter ATP-binding protein EcfA2
MPSPSDISLFARTNARASFRTFGLKQADRLFHLYAIGKTGSGKSTLLETLALQDIRAGRGCAVIDPHGDLVARLAASVPPERTRDFVYLNAPAMGQPYGYNPLRRIRTDKIPLAASGLMEAFKKLWDEAWGVRMEHILRNALYALLEQEEARLPDLLRLISDSAFRRQVVGTLQNEQVKKFWLAEFPKYNPRYRQESIAPIQNKVGAFLADPRLYRILVEPEIDLRFRKIMDEGKVLLVNLSKGELGEDSSTLLGSLLVTTLSLAAFSRAETQEAVRKPFFIYIDEFQSFTTLSVAGMISELRKFEVGLILANQHLQQLEREVRSAVLGNVGTLVTFRLGPEDAHLLAKELRPTFTELDIMSLGNHDIYLRLMIDGRPSPPFSATTLHPRELE